MATKRSHALLLPLSQEQRARIDRVSHLLNAAPEDLALLMIFGGFDSECELEGFRKFAEANLNTYANGEASDAAVGGRIEDQAEATGFRILE